jgi:hypothetical protein
MGILATSKLMWGNRIGKKNIACSSRGGTQMLRKTGSTLTVVLATVALVGQQTPTTPASAVASEFPVLMRQNIDAGKTPVGAKIEAKLVVATLWNGTVIPKDTIFSGEVTESGAKSATESSRLAIRIDSARWKNGSAPIQLYLTSWFYPPATMAPPDLSYGPTDAEHTPRKWNGDGPYYDPKSPVYQPSPGQASPLHPVPNTTNHRIPMKDMGCLRDTAGGLVITSKRSNIKIDKSTTYVLAASELLPSAK